MTVQEAVTQLLPQLLRHTGLPVRLQVFYPPNAIAVSIYCQEYYLGVVQLHEHWLELWLNSKQLGVFEYGDPELLNRLDRLLTQQFTSRMIANRWS